MADPDAAAYLDSFDVFVTLNSSFECVESLRLRTSGLRAVRVATSMRTPKNYRNEAFNMETSAAKWNAGEEIFGDLGNELPIVSSSSLAIVRTYTVITSVLPL